MKIKPLLKTLAALFIIVGFGFGYAHRRPLTVHFSSLSGPIAAEPMKYSTIYEEAKAAPDLDRISVRMRIYWDLWCLATTADIEEPKAKDGLVFYRVAPRTDELAAFVYVFDTQGHFLHFTFFPISCDF